ncbi:MAG: hypothetical protein ABS55_01620 [Lautropia sp. SCN 70-15]|nr:MAG: hypothetical protein ABS55_01620 [Lautropia sp. SCN 70-15]
MRILSKKLGQACAGLAVALSLGVAAPAKADVVQLGFILDSSGSIGSGNWNVIRQGLSDAIDLIPVSGTTQYEVSVVTFGNTVSTPVANFLITDVASRDTLSNQVAGLTFLNGSATNYAIAFSAMTTALSTTIANASASYVNFATDGAQNQGGTGIPERNALIAAGVDNISIEGIGSGVDAADLQTNFCYPGPCDTTVPYNFPAQGFYIGVANAAGYAGAIGNKVRIVTGQVPEPQMIALLGIGLLGLTPLMRRRRQD